MEQLQLNDMVPGSIYSINYDGYKYNNYIFVGKHFYRLDDANTCLKKIKRNYIYGHPLLIKYIAKPKLETGY